MKRKMMKSKTEEWNRNTPRAVYIHGQTSIRVSFEVDGEINKDQS